MAKPKEKTVLDAIQDQTIIQLLLAGVGQHDVRSAVGVDIHRVSRIAKLLAKRRRADER